MGLGVFASHKIEDKRWPATIILAPGIAHIHNLQHPAHADALAIQRLTGRSLLRLFNQFGNALSLLLLVVLAQRLSVLLHPAFDGVAVHKEGLMLQGLGLLHLPVAIDVLDGPDGVIGIGLAHFLNLFLVFRPLVNQLEKVREPYTYSSVRT